MQTLWQSFGLLHAANFHRGKINVDVTMSKMRRAIPPTQSTSFDDLTGSEWNYGYALVPAELKPDEIKLWCQKNRRQATIAAKNLTSTGRAEWIVRHYFATKLILAATVMLSSDVWSTGHGMQIASPYLRYYALFNCARALILTAIEQPWKEGLIVRPGFNHTKVANLTESILRSINDGLGRRVRELFHCMKNYRELGSYAFPGSALSAIPGRSSTEEFDEVFRVCMLLCELAQLQSECTYASIKKHMPVEAVVGQEDITATLTLMTDYEMPDGSTTIDDVDYFQIGRFLRKGFEILPLCVVLNEGAVDDIIGAWRSTEGPSRKTGYDPDTYARVMFDFM